jgi:hypothetical protein
MSFFTKIVASALTVEKISSLFPRFFPNGHFFSQIPHVELVALEASCNEQQKSRPSMKQGRDSAPLLIRSPT